jgi:hypothetical protein
MNTVESLILVVAGLFYHSELWQQFKTKHCSVVSLKDVL